jgi:hypothetical protein
LNKTLTDITDGRIYQKMITNDPNDGFLNRKALSFLINTDGISLSNSSNLTIWPVYLVINEVPIESRFLIDNVILAAMSTGEKKPNFNLLLQSVVKQLKRLEYGTSVCFADKEHEIKFFLMAGIFDKPARYGVLNMIQFNGSFGCTKCLQEGKNIKHNDTSMIECLYHYFIFIKSYFLDGTSHVYPYNNDDPSGPKRTDDSYEIHLQEVINTKTDIYGVKGPCILSNCKYFKPISSTCIDYMHSVLEGVIKKLFTHWFDSKYSSKCFSIRKFMHTIDDRILLIRPPKFVPSTPRSIYIYSLWHAHEYLTFILYYSLAVLNEALPCEYYQHLVKLVIFMENLLFESIEEQNMIIVEEIIREFVQELETLYGEDAMLSGEHELLHLVDMTKDFGPLNNVNCFQFEELNRKLIRFIHGTDLVGEELAKIFSTAQLLYHYTRHANNEKIKEFILTNMSFKSSNRKKRSNNLMGQVIIKSKMEISIDPKILLLLKNLKIDANVINVCTKLQFNGIFYDSYLCKTKRSDACILTSSGEYALIDKFLLINDTVYVLTRTFVEMMCPFYAINFPDFTSKVTICNLSDVKKIFLLKEIEKVVAVMINERRYIVSSFSMTHLFH